MDYVQLHTYVYPKHCLGAFTIANVIAAQAEHRFINNFAVVAIFIFFVAVVVFCSCSTLKTAIQLAAEKDCHSYYFTVVFRLIRRGVGVLGRPRKNC